MSHPTFCAWWVSCSRSVSPLSAPVRAATTGPVGLSSSIATYGRRRASATVLTTIGRTSSGSPGAVQPTPHVGDQLVGILTVAEHHRVDLSLEERPQRLGDQRDEAGRGDEELGVLVLLQQEGEAFEAQGVGGDHHHGSRSRARAPG